MAENEIVKRKKSSNKLIAFLVILIIFILVGGFAYFEYMIFKIKAEGIAIGYERAAAAASQMGRPIPDSIFEEGNYRVEVKSILGASQTDITINVKDLYSNVTHYTLTRTINATAVVPENKKQ